MLPFDSEVMCDIGIQEFVGMTIVMIKVKY